MPRHPGSKNPLAYLEYDTAKKLAQLEPKILVLERVMQVVETSPYRPRLEQLFKELKTAYYEAEEILDAVEYHCLERPIKDGKLQPGGTAPPPKKDHLKKIRSAMAKISLLTNKVLSLLRFVLISLSPSNFVVPCTYMFLEKPCSMLYVFAFPSVLVHFFSN